MTDQAPDRRSGEYQYTRALQIIDDDERTGAYHELEEAKLHALLAVGAYLRDLTAMLAAKPMSPVEMVPAARVAEMAADIVRDLQQEAKA